MSDETLSDITLPSFGSSVGGATLVEWRVAEGATVEAGQAIADIETDKAITELEAPQSGVIESILVPGGSEDLEAGTVLARMRVAGARPENPPARGTGARDVAAAAPTALEEAPAVPQATSASGSRVAASPYARRIARERQVPLDDMAGSGPNGRIVSRDVPPGAVPALPSSGPDLAADASPELADAGHEPGTYQLEPVSRMRRAIAASLLRSVREIPSYSLAVDIDLDAALDFRRACNEAADGTARISLNDIVVQACARALLDVPAVNSAWTDDGIARFRHANVAVAVATDSGLVAPVLRAADTLTLQQVSTSSRELVRRAHEGRLSVDELRGATFTVSNLGMRGIRAFNSIPGILQGAILSVGAAEPRPVVTDNKVVIATRASFTLTCDHRVIDGAVGARFLERLRERLATPHR